jgi:hypothetical protein
MFSMGANVVFAADVGSVGFRQRSSPLSPCLTLHIVDHSLGDRCPDRFPAILKTYPNLLPCAVVAIFTSVAWLVTYLCFREVSVV